MDGGRDAPGDAARLAAAARRRSASGPRVFAPVLSTGLRQGSKPDRAKTPTNSQGRLGLQEPGAQACLRGRPIETEAVLYVLCGDVNYRGNGPAHKYALYCDR
jgi:hypothetical protein